VVGAMGVKFLAHGNNNSRMPHRTWNLAITSQMPWQPAYLFNYFIYLFLFLAIRLRSLLYTNSLYKNIHIICQVSIQIGLEIV